MSGRRRRRCRGCGGDLHVSRFDVAVLDPDTECERLFFGLAGTLCLDCSSLVFDRDTRLLLDIAVDAVVSAIETDTVLSEGLAA